MRNNFLIIFLLIAQNCFAQEIPSTLSPADKVYGLSRFWQEVNYNFVYLDRINRQTWDSTYKKLIPAVEQSRNDYEYYRLLQRFCALLKDGHTNVFPSPAIDGLVYGKMFGKYWFALEDIEGKAIVTRTLKSDTLELPVGTEVIAVNGLPAAQYARENVEPYVSSSTDYVRQRLSMQNLLSGLMGASYDVTFKRPDGKVFDVHLTHAKTTAKDFYPEIAQLPLLELKWYPGKIAYLAFNSFANEAIDSIFLSKLPELYQARGLIIDLRNNGGGNTGIGTAILQYLMKDSLMQHLRSFTRQHLPAYKAWGAFIASKDTAGNPGNTKLWLAFHDRYFYDFGYTPDTIHVAAKRLIVPTAILTGNTTASAAEDFLISAANQPHMIRIGERTFGSTGQPFLFDLGGGLTARVCTKKDTYPDGSDFVGVGIKPDIEVAPTLKDFLAHTDPVLDNALSYLKTQIGK